jgi:hypothetical protein
MSGRVVRASRAVAVATAVALVGLTFGQAPAQAAAFTVEDSRGDMIKVQEGATEGVPAPGATIADFKRTAFRHKDRVVIVRASFVDLARTGRRLTLWVDIRNDSGRHFTVGVQADRDDWTGRTLFLTRSGDKCTIRHHIDYRANIIRVAVPRRCLDRPRTVAFRVLSEHVRRSWNYSLLDNGLAESMEDRSWTRPLRRG